MSSIEDNYLNLAFFKLHMKSQGLPISTIVLIIIGIVALAFVIMFALTQKGKSEENTQSFWDIFESSKEDAQVASDQLMCPEGQWDDVNNICCPDDLSPPCS